jgi:phage-related protein
MSYGFLNVGGVLSTDYNIFVLGVDDANIPVRDYSVYSIPGRSRDLHYDNGRFENIDRTYHLYARAIGSVSAEDAVMAFCAELMQLKGYQRISDSIHPDYFKLGEFRGGVEPQFSPREDGVRFDLTFDCDARKYLTSGESETDITNTGSGTWQSKTLVNPGTLPARPLVIFSDMTSTNCAINYNNQYVMVDKYSGTLVFDCELGDAYDRTSHANLNSYISRGSLLELQPGSNSISVKTGETIKIIPRWNKL